MMIALDDHGDELAPEARTHLAIEVLTDSRRMGNMDFRLTQHAVTVWLDRALLGWLDRHNLWSWLTSPRSVLRGTRLSFAAITNGNHTGVTITCWRVAAFVVPPITLDSLRSLVQLS